VVSKTPRFLFRVLPGVDFLDSRLKALSSLHSRCDFGPGETLNAFLSVVG
jgi:hypothetical protein